MHMFWWFLITGCGALGWWCSSPPEGIFLPTPQGWGCWGVMFLQGLQTQGALITRWHHPHIIWRNTTRKGGFPVRKVALSLSLSLQCRYAELLIWQTNTGTCRFCFLQLCWLLRDKRMPLYYVLLQCLNVTWLSSHHLSSLGLKP